jgi:subtilisin-like proprotein convertase family protein
MDMIGYDSDNDGMTTLATNDMSEHLADDYIFIRDMYDLPLSNNFSSASNSDHSSFWNNGYAAIQVSEDTYDFNNKYHTSGDDVYNMNIPYYRKQVQAVFVTMATLSMDLNMEMMHEQVQSGPSTEPREAWLTINSNHNFVFGAEPPRLYYSTNGLNFLSVEPTHSQADTFFFMIPGHPYGSTVYYYLAAQNDAATMIATLPEGGRGINPPGTIRPGEYFSYNIDNTFYLNTCSNTLPKAIIDLENTWDTIAVQDDWEVEDLDVSVDITHPTTEDVEIYLISPEGEQIAISVAHGGLGDNYSGTIFDDEAELSIGDAQPPYTGRFKPDESLSVFDGKPMTGEWVLMVYDNDEAFEGTLNSWCLTFTYSMPVSIREEHSDELVLIHNYPNPACEYTNVVFELNEAQWVSISAHNLMGHEIGKIAQRHFDDGRHILHWNLPNLPSGYYFFKFSTDKSVEMMPFMVVQK